MIFEKITVGINEGDRIGIVGRNGDGKSTLLQLLDGRLEPDSGRVTKRRGVTIGMLDQKDVLDSELTVAQAIVGDTEEYIWAGDGRTRDIIDGLLSDLPWTAKIGTLSGGQRRRVALAALLVGDWDIIFLDEPTNHLDVEGISWLAGHLKSRWSPNSGGLVVVTHDRWFLDEVCNNTWEVHDGIIEPFEGGYAAYILQRVERDRSAAVSEAKRQNLMKKELAWLRRGAPARTAKPKFRIEAANALIEDVPPIRNTVAMSQMATSRLGKDVVDILDASVVYGDKTVLDTIEWRIAPGERTGILGVNGAGKSTLLGLVTGDVQPTSGIVKRGKTVKIASLTQQLDELKDIENERVSDVIGRYRTSYKTGDKEMTPGQLLEQMGFMSVQLQTPVKDLSGGQRRRLQLLLILLDEPNVLILDEPTNDLDTDMLAAMEDLLDTWPGTLLVVSHDRYLLERVTDNQFAVMGGALRHLPGGVDQYLQIRAGTERSEQRPDELVAGGGAAKPATGLTGAALRAAEKERSANERKQAKLGGEIEKLQASMATHDQADYAGLGEISASIAAKRAEIDALELAWLEVSERIDG